MKIIFLWFCAILSTVLGTYQDWYMAYLFMIAMGVWGIYLKLGE
jgi:hypothetical protein